MNDVVEAHANEAPDVLPELKSIFDTLKIQLLEHLIKEEQNLFPSILANKLNEISTPLHQMEEEHAKTGLTLIRIRELTNNYKINPQAHPNASDAWHTLWKSLDELEKSLRQHTYLEDKILLPAVKSRTA